MKRRLAFAACASLALAGAVPGSVAAQVTSHPAHIHVGRCPAPGNVVVSLWDVSEDFLVDGEVAAGELVGPQSGAVVEASVTIAELTLDEMLATEHAIVVHQSADAMDTYLVCGDIGGQLMDPDELPVALEPVGDSAWSGIAVLDDDGETTTVSVYIVEGFGGTSGDLDPGTPDGRPAGDDDDGAGDDDDGADDDRAGDDTGGGDTGGGDDGDDDTGGDTGGGSGDG